MLKALPGLMRTATLLVLALACVPNVALAYSSRTLLTGDECGGKDEDACGVLLVHGHVYMRPGGPGVAILASTEHAHAACPTSAQH